ncbi:MAG: hypothetical protein ACLQLC_13165 [Candidatus Sulfotelmatobacter sp.]
MTDEIKHGNGNGGYEHQDLGASGILYFLLILGVTTMICMAGLKGLYAYLDHREKADQIPVNPLVTQVPEDTRHVAPGYPATAFPSPRLERIEGDELNADLIQEQKTLYSYGWVDQNAGTVHIPIDRAMDLLVKRGLPVRPQVATNEVAAENAARDQGVVPAADKKDMK